MRWLFLFLVAHGISWSFEHHVGDLLFQDLDCGPLCDAIEEVTDGHKGHRFSHVGILAQDKEGAWEVIEAIGEKVHTTPLAQFLKRSHDEKKRAKVAVGRLKDEDAKVIDAAILYARKKMDVPYDEIFLLGEAKLYCSELVFYAFRNAKGRAIFALNRMTFKKPDSDEYYPAWKDYFAKLKTPIPEGKQGINPGGISWSDELEIFYPYGEISKK